MSLQEPLIRLEVIMFETLISVYLCRRKSGSRHEHFLSFVFTEGRSIINDSSCRIQSNNLIPVYSMDWFDGEFFSLSIGLTTLSVYLWYLEVLLL